MPPKFKCLALLYHVFKESVFDKTLLDLGARVNLFPYSTYMQLRLGELNSTLLFFNLLIS